MEAKLKTLFEVTQLPTAAGREGHVVRYIKDWVAARPELGIETDVSGNLTVKVKGLEGPNQASESSSVLYFTAHLDHPAFVVEKVLPGGRLLASFRGGVMADYFVNARVALYAGEPDAKRAGELGVGTVLSKEAMAGSPFDHYLIEIDPPARASDAVAEVKVGDIARWDVPRAEVCGDGTFHTDACDDLSAVAAMLDAIDGVLKLMKGGEKFAHPVRLLFTRAEEVGFIGAIAAVRNGTIPHDARVIALENSRSFADAPIHDGPIVRVGDRLSIFSPTLTDSIAARAEELSGAVSPTAQQKIAEQPKAKFKWQRKLMAGGACEASVFYSSGYDATCVCLPLGNYHNMVDLAAVQAGTNASPAVVEREFIGVDDYLGMVELLVGCAQRMPVSAIMHSRIEKLWGERSFVLG
jgi:putative aminopeptidase FrvX